MFDARFVPSAPALDQVGLERFVAATRRAVLGEGFKVLVAECILAEDPVGKPLDGLGVPSPQCFPVTILGRR